MKKGYVKSASGHYIRIEDMRESLTKFPGFCRKQMAQDGTPYLSNCVTTEPKCGCKIEGNGTLQFPVTIKFCQKHDTV